MKSNSAHAVPAAGASLIHAHAGAARYVAAAAMATFAAHSHAVEAVIDQFTVTRNGTVFFADPFGDGNEPPSAPSFSTGTAAAYSVFGAFPGDAESGGVLRMNTDHGGVTANAVESPRSTLAALLLTGTGTTGTALSINDTLAISATFNLLTPTGPLFAAYGIQATDAAGEGPHQLAQLAVRYIESTGAVEIAYLLQDFDNNSITLLGSAPLAPPGGTQQIAFSIARPNAANSQFFGSFQYLAGGSAIGGSAFDTPAILFQGESFVRGRFFAAQGVTAPIPEPATVTLMGLGLAALGWRRRGAANALSAALRDGGGWRSLHRRS